ncbi:hypothetical protein [Arenibaculum pallidiluteum]|uniref:hypothetical protein n=1 Tax=Arenibaculum pallidiluteum TaxID=2812559 RepID=UPI001A9781B6|nr:hypothetical protein [Arenibaculum pallidiluteum]
MTDGMMACRTEDGLREVVKAAHARDGKRFSSVPGCTLTKPGQRVEVIAKGPAISRVRIVAPNGSAMEMVTWNQNLVARDQASAAQGARLVGMGR